MKLYNIIDGDFVFTNVELSEEEAAMLKANDIIVEEA